MEWQHFPVPLLSTILSSLSFLSYNAVSTLLNTPAKGRSLLFSCHAAEGITEGCNMERYTLHHCKTYKDPHF